MKLFNHLLVITLLATWLPTSHAETQATDDTDSKTLIWPDGTRYVGSVKDGKRFGKGTIYWEDGTRFVGTFRNDMRNGPGTMILPDGTVYNGYFQDDQLVQAPSEPGAPEVAASVLADARAGNADSTAPNVDAAAVVATTPAPARTNPISTPEPVTPAPAPVVTAVTAPEAAAPATNEIQTIESSTGITTLTDDVRQSLEATVDEWASAWEAQDVSRYLAAYSIDFSVPGRQSRSAWEALRRSRLTRPGQIRIDIAFDLFEIVAEDTAEVTFKQTYSSPVYSDVTNKTLILGLEGNTWKILEERSN